MFAVFATTPPAALAVIILTTVVIGWADHDRCEVATGLGIVAALASAWAGGYLWALGL